ncbi:MAG TPA: 4Fe-4S binding protein [Deltaproteobacteria bacterium]|nr:4Fe-4S binding protein [Deltaproteobacteria bacterium]
MKKMRQIIQIDEEKCTGCGQCILACAEGALALVDGKAKLVGEIYCDGIGACIGECPEGALTIVEREADEFDEDAVEKHLQNAHKSGINIEDSPQKTLACGCPSSVMTTLEKKRQSDPAGTPLAGVSELGHWPIKLQLLGPHAPFLRGADLILLADCAAAAYPNLHQHLLKDRAVAMGCPKLDNLETHIQRLAEILKGASPQSLTVVHMEVPCCKAFVSAAHEAIRRSGVHVPLNYIVIARDGTIMEEGQACSSREKTHGLVTLNTL